MNWWGDAGIKEMMRIPDREGWDDDGFAVRETSLDLQVCGL